MLSRSPSASRSSTDRRHAAGALALGALIGAALAFDLAARRSRRASRELAHETEQREAERERLQAQLVTAEQDERRRLALFLHDGPLQSLAGIALMHDAALEALGEGRTEDATRILETASTREREAIRTLRDLSFAIEPVILRDRGFAAAVRELAEQVERARNIPVALDLTAADELGESARIALYQTVREALNQALRRDPGRISLAVGQRADGSVVAAVADDGVDERRRGSLDAIGERAAVAGGRVTQEPAVGGGTVVLVTLPAYAASV